MATCGCVNWRLEGETRRFDDENGVPLQTLWQLVVGPMEARLNHADGSAVLVNAMQEAFAHSALRQEFMPKCFRFTVATLLIGRGPGFAILHNVLVDLHLRMSPIQGRHNHDQGLFNVPFTSSQKAQDQGIWMIVLYHGPECFPYLLWLLAGKDLLILLRQAELVIVK